MFFRRLYDDDLAQASYLVGCERTRQAMVVDPTRDVEKYVEAAGAQRLRITSVTETHIHADFASGARALARRVKAQLLLSGEGGKDWSYAFGGEPGTRLLGDGDTFEVGQLRITALHTPGHTPEHLTFVLTDLTMAESPVGAFTGDFVFVGDVGRPDLLERAARQAGTMESSARTLFASLKRFKEHPDYLQIWPGHGAGSACGKSLGAMPQSTLGFERRFNWGLAEESEDAFMAAVLEGQPEPPRYFARMKTLNRDAQMLDPIPVAPRPMEPAAVADLIRGSAQVIDLRPTAEFGQRHIVGSVNIPAGRSFANYAGSLVDYDRGIFLLAADAAGDAVARASRTLSLIGTDDAQGVFDLRAIDAAERAGIEIARTPQASLAQFDEAIARGAGIHVLDVRGGSEWRAGHIAGALHIPLPELIARLGEIPPDGTLFVHCESGSRSAIAASVLESLGRRDVVNVSGGFKAWLDAGRPVELEEAIQAGEQSP